MLSKGRLILWCYLIWRCVVLVKYSDGSPQLWLTSQGLSGIIGYALYLSTAGSGTTRVKLNRWQLFRPFLMPFCVSSFAALVKNKGFILIFSPRPGEIMIAGASRTRGRGRLMTTSCWMMAGRRLITGTRSASCRASSTSRVTNRTVL